ncbi:uncharacterized protein [Palaemon carinicauda]|uniref:uncharacterized protein n=1 Tax=Palaemon carinicauda TaxID=392227 RepID=UPI0035B6A884
MKEKLIVRIPEFEAHKKGWDIIFAFKEDIRATLHYASSYSDTIILSKAADILRKEMLKYKTKFGKENDDFAVETIPCALIEYVCSIGDGIDINSHLANETAKSNLVIAQLLQYNSYSKPK